MISKKKPEVSFFEAPLSSFEEQHSHFCPANISPLAETKAIMPQPEKFHI